MWRTREPAATACFCCLPVLSSSIVLASTRSCRELTCSPARNAPTLACSGAIDMDELYRMLRQRPDPPTLLTRSKLQRTLHRPPGREPKRTMVPHPSPALGQKPLPSMASGRKGYTGHVISPRDISLFNPSATAPAGALPSLPTWHTHML
eukprot:1685311-Prymnesium_polylepis.1